MKYKYLVRIVLVGAVLFLSIVYLDGVTLSPIVYGIVPAFVLLLAVFAVVEVLLYPVVKMLILPLRLLSFGLASAVLSVVMVYAVAFIFPFFTIASLWQGVVMGAGFGIARLLTK